MNPIDYVNIVLGGCIVLGFAALVAAIVMGSKGVHRSRS